MIDQSSPLHFSISLLLVLISSNYIKHNLKLFLFAVILCVAKEFYDDHVDYYDLLFDSIGVALGMVLVIFYKRGKYV